MFHDSENFVEIFGMMDKNPPLEQYGPNLTQN